ncbi:MAG: hypothetical protein ACRCU9_09145, partial [Iodobacter sp.]
MGIFAPAAIFLTGCASSSYSINEGSTHAAIYTKGAKSVTSQGLYIAGSALDSEGTIETIIKREDAFSVRLLSAFICDFRENSSFLDMVDSGNKNAIPCSGGDGGQHGGTRGEIAIIANVGER